MEYRFVQSLVVWWGFFLLATSCVWGQTGSLGGSIWSTTLEGPLEFGMVKLSVRGAVVNGAITDFNGDFRIEGLAPGVYEVEVSLGGTERSMGAVEVGDGPVRVEWEFDGPCLYQGKHHERGRCPKGRHGRRGVIPVVYGMILPEERAKEGHLKDFYWAGCGVSDCMARWYCMRHEHLF